MIDRVFSEFPANSVLAGSRLAGQVLGEAFVSSGKAVISDQVRGSLRVNKGSEVQIYGQIMGDLLVEGRAYLHGMVEGKALILGDGQLERASSSRVGGRLAK